MMVEYPEKINEFMLDDETLTNIENNALKIEAASKVKGSTKKEKNIKDKEDSKKRIAKKANSNKN